MIKDISNKLLKDFSACLAENIEAPAAAEAAREDRRPPEGGVTPDDPGPSGAPVKAEAAAAAAAPPAPMRPSQPVKPVNGLALFFSALWARIRRLFGRGD